MRLVKKFFQKSINKKYLKSSKKIKKKTKKSINLLIKNFLTIVKRLKIKTIRRWNDKQRVENNNF